MEKIFKVAEVVLVSSPWFVLISKRTLKHCSSIFFDVVRLNSLNFEKNTLRAPDFSSIANIGLKQF
jgi:hypothetical protein